VVDSLGLDEFASLPDSERQLRRRLAEMWRQRAVKAETSQQQVASLRNAAGLAPDNGELWLELADLYRWLGDPRVTDAYVQAASAGVKYAPVRHQQSLRFRIALLRSWLHYARGEWRQGLSWADYAGRIYAQDRQLQLIAGLLAAGAERSIDATWIAQDIERQEFSRSDWRWIRGMTEFAKGRLAAAAFYMVDLRPDPLHRAEFWNDLGLLQESLGNWREARRSYRRALNSLPLKDIACLDLCERQHPLADGKAPALPVWLGFGRFYATGSLPTYVALAVERCEGATDSLQREFWAEAAIRAATICLQKNLGEPWTRAWRGRIRAQLELNDPAERDLQQAVSDFAQMGWQDASALFWLGQVRLKQEDYAAARLPLEQAVAVDSTQARAWSSLGLALIMTQDLPAAERALGRALQLDPTLAVAWYNRGLMSFHAQRWADAVRDLEQAARLAPGNPDIISILQRARLLAERQPQSVPDPP
jgi:tetratricopeptide (TPR) repeat protein